MHMSSSVGIIFISWSVGCRRHPYLTGEFRQISSHLYRESCIAFWISFPFSGIFQISLIIKNTRKRMQSIVCCMFFSYNSYRWEWFLSGISDFKAWNLLLCTHDFVTIWHGIYRFTLREDSEGVFRVDLHESTEESNEYHHRVFYEREKCDW